MHFRRTDELASVVSRAAVSQRGRLSTHALRPQLLSNPPSRCLQRTSLIETIWSTILPCFDPRPAALFWPDQRLIVELMRRILNQIRVILEPEDYDLWLNPAVQDREKL